SSLPARSRTRSGGFRAGMGRVEAAFMQGFGGPRPGSRRIAATKLYDAHGAPTRSRSRAPIAISSDVQPRRFRRVCDTRPLAHTRQMCSPAEPREILIQGCKRDLVERRNPPTVAKQNATAAGMR